MTHVSLDYDVWTEAAYEYVRDQLRAHATVGIKGTSGTRVIEIGSPLLAELASDPESLPAVWITPDNDDQRESQMAEEGVWIVHNIRLQFTVFTLIAPRSSMESADLEKTHRQYAGKVYSAIGGLNEAGRAASHWREFTPDRGGVRRGSLQVDDARVLLGSTITFNLIRDRKWVT